LTGPRIEAILSLIEPSKTLADIGCDHGFVARAALKKGLAQEVMLSDISAACLDKARRILAGDPRASFTVGDGFDGLPKEAERAVIAGMGGRVIAGIVRRCPYRPALILGPQRDIPFLRGELNALGYRIEAERFIKEGGRYYVLMRAAAGRQDLDETARRLNALYTVKNAEFAAYLAYLRDKYGKFPPTETNKKILRQIEEAYVWQR
jgi:tRNA (adenine22-N1)-methyltransferase